eukprot:1531332-Prymnesium_polylepis.1
MCAARVSTRRACSTAAHRITSATCACSGCGARGVCSERIRSTAPAHASWSVPHPELKQTTRSAADAAASEARASRHARSVSYTHLTLPTICSV